MSLIASLHGELGILDELLVCGVLLASGLVIFFLTALFGKRSQN